MEEEFPLTAPTERNNNVKVMDVVCTCFREAEGQRERDKREGVD